MGIIESFQQATQPDSGNEKKTLSVRDILQNKKNSHLFGLLLQTKGPQGERLGKRLLEGTIEAADVADLESYGEEFNHLLEQTAQVEGILTSESINSVCTQSPELQQIASLVGAEKIRTIVLGRIEALAITDPGRFQYVMDALHALHTSQENIAHVNETLQGLTEKYGISDEEFTGILQMSDDEDREAAFKALLERRFGSEKMSRAENLDVCFDEAVESPIMWGVRAFESDFAGAGSIDNMREFMKTNSDFRYAAQSVQLSEDALMNIVGESDTAKRKEMIRELFSEQYMQSRAQGDFQQNIKNRPWYQRPFVRNKIRAAAGAPYEGMGSLVQRWPHIQEDLDVMTTSRTGIEGLLRANQDALQVLGSELSASVVQNSEMRSALADALTAEKPESADAGIESFGNARSALASEDDMTAAWKQYLADEAIDTSVTPADDTMRENFRNAFVAKRCRGKSGGWMGVVEKWMTQAFDPQGPVWKQLT